ncbi:ATP-dependent nuclease [Paenibacillus sp. FSL H8-0260]|uniref:ATP-dependent nuclease n=1 Tax=Paenibacillus sp. FSL H8-0260 TaxID=2921380 RepID=UPI003243364B
MYLNSLRLWNWRKFSSVDENPGIEVEFSEGLNVIVGENDSGKTAIIDAIKLTLNTNSHDMNWLTEQDFYEGSKSLKIECIFQKLSPQEEAFFYEWLTIQSQTSELRILLEADIYEDINKQKKIKKSIKAGPENLESVMEDTTRQLLAITYLKPLRDAASELSPGKYSRIAQVIKSLKDFADDSQDKEDVIKSFSDAFDGLKRVLDTPVLKKIESTIDDFFEKNNKKSPIINNKKMDFPEILKKLELNLGETGTGLGSSNLLFMAVELLLLSETEIGPKIALIEEIEAHIHPQAQLRVIKHFEKNALETGMQYIFTSHSPILAASIDLKHIIFIYNNKSFSMKPGQTKLEEDDYEFLDRFLDATKANLFFARSVIFVEGDAENLLLPAVAEIIERPLYRYGVSIINIGSLAFKRYSNILLRSNENKPMNFPISLITDLDLKPVDYYEDEPCYFMITRKSNEQISNLYKDAVLDPALEDEIFVQLKDLITKANTLYGGQAVKSKEEKKRLSSEIAKVITEEAAYTVSNTEGTYYEKYKTEKISTLKTRYFDNNEQTRVYISHPWTLEHSIACSSLGEQFEDVLLQSHYIKIENQNTQKSEWSGIADKNKRGTEVYSFLLEKEVSKSIVAQRFAKYLIDNKSLLKEQLLADDSLKHLIDAIKHVTGGETGGV